MPSRRRHLKKIPGDSVFLYPNLGLSRHFSKQMTFPTLSTQRNRPSDSCPHGRFHPIRPERVLQRQKALELFERNVSFKPVAQELGLSAWTVRGWHREWKQGRFNVVPKSRVYREEFRERVMADVNKAEEVRRTALRWDLPYATVKKWFDRKVKEEATR